MTKTRTFLKVLAKLVFAGALTTTFIQCSEEEVLPAQTPRALVQPDTTTRSLDSTTTIKDCKTCTYVVPAGTKVIDGKQLGLKPGDVIGLSSAIKYGTLEFHNIVGAPGNPIVIKNCGGTANIVANDKWHALRTQNSKHFRITGGTQDGVYGIKVQGGEMGLKLDGLSTDFEVDHVEVFNVKFAGIMAKTDPTCDDATIRGNFTMRDVELHNNYVHHTGGEGFYIGNSFWDGMDRSCGIRLPHEIRGLKVFNNIVEHTGWEAIQVGCAIEGTEIHDNEIRFYGEADIQHQNNGLQIGSGTGGLVYNNFIKHGPGNGMIVLGTGDNVIHNNIIVNAGGNGIFCDERYTPGPGFRFINNTIVNPGNDGIRLYAELVPMNTVVNNIIANPGSYDSYSNSRTSAASFVYLQSTDMRVNLANNLFAKTVEELNFVDPDNDDYQLKPNSPAINYGRDISRYRINKDFYKKTRLRGFAYDVGASEY